MALPWRIFGMPYFLWIYIGIQVLRKEIKIETPSENYVSNCKYLKMRRIEPLTLYPKR